MELRVAKELMHIDAWLTRVAEIVATGREAYLGNPLLQEAGDSLMMKIGEAANRLSKMGVAAPGDLDWAIAVANRNFVIHQYDVINRAMTWQTLAKDLALWQSALVPLVAQARRATGADA